MKNQKRKNPLNLAGIFVASIIILALVQVFVSYRLSTAGKIVGELENETAQVRSENKRLKEEISQTGALALVYEKALKLGFKPVEEIVYLTSEVPVALGH